MGVYIKGMEMPTIDLEWRIIRGEDGRWYAIDVNAETSDGEWHKIVPVPKHGDLIDMNAKIDVYDRWDDDIIRPSTVRDLINEYISGGYPRAIIPAEEGE